MKYSLTILLLILIFFSSIKINAQTRTQSNTQTISLDIPDYLQSDEKVTSFNSLQNKTETRYFEEIQGYVTVTFTKDGTVLSITAPAVMSKNILTSKSNEDKNEISAGPDEFKKCKEGCNGNTWCIIKCAIKHLM